MKGKNMEQGQAGGLVTPSPSKQNYKKTTFFSRVLIGLIILAISFGGGWLGARSYGGDDDQQSIVAQKAAVVDTAKLLSSIADDLKDSVVSVTVTSRERGRGSEFSGFGYGRYERRSAGTGIILTSDGLILTNRHVVPDGTTDVSVTLSDGTLLERVKVVARTSKNDSLDIAFLKVTDKEDKKLQAAKLGDSSKMNVGDGVVAIGNTLGQFQNTVTSGIISGYGRSLVARAGSGGAAENLDDMFQTDAAINQGNSGGPLVNMDGEVIGVNTAMASGAQTVGFAIPINNVKGMIDNVKRTGKIERPFLGVIYIILTDDIAEEYDLKAKRGAYIPKASEMGSSATILKDGPADSAGIREGDIILEIDGVKIGERSSPVSLLSRHKAGDTVKMTILRGSDKKTIRVKLGTVPES
ncbi:hypothetical protein CSA80_03800 [Candidatus Saccharibacteria bacterium]|nr:MAG: hypothetical protein CSA80_03800 [Candidatus Saccharibacteria bacterium]